MLTNFDKAIVPVVVVVIMAILSRLGVTPDMSAQQIVTLLVTAAAVYLVPNKA